MAVNFSNGTMYAAPRIIETKDGRSGCPPSAARGSTLISHSFTVSNTARIWTHGRIIFYGPAAGNYGPASRADFDLVVAGSVVKRALNNIMYTDGTIPSNWEELDATWMGTLGAGTHTIYMAGQNGASCWGCGTAWGQLTTVIWEAG